MAMVVSPEVAKLFQVLTGEEWPDANEDELRALAGEWTAAAQTLAQLGPGLRSAVQAIRSDFAGEAAQAFAERVAPFVEGDDLVSAAAQLFNDLAQTLLDLALDVEYMKIVTIASLVALLAEIAWATAMAPFTGGATMSWLAARMAVVRFLIQNLLGRVLVKVLSTAVFSIAFQLLIDVVAQTAQFAMGTREEWNTDHTKNAAGVGAMGAALALPLGGLGKLAGKGLNTVLNSVLSTKFGKDWAKRGTEVLEHVGTEAFHEMLTEAVYKYATEGEFELNPYAATAGASSGIGSAGGAALGHRLAGLSGGGHGGGTGSSGPQPSTADRGLSDSGVSTQDTTDGIGQQSSTTTPQDVPATRPGTPVPGPQGPTAGQGGHQPPAAQPLGGEAPSASPGSTASTASSGDSSGQSGTSAQGPGARQQSSAQSQASGEQDQPNVDQRPPDGAGPQPHTPVPSRGDVSPQHGPVTQGTGGQQPAAPSGTTPPSSGPVAGDSGTAGTGTANPEPVAQQGPPTAGGHGVPAVDRPGETSGQQAPSTPPGGQHDVPVVESRTDGQNPPAVQGQPPDPTAPAHGTGQSPEQTSAPPTGHQPVEPNQAAPQSPDQTGHGGTAGTSDPGPQSVSREDGPGLSGRPHDGDPAGSPHLQQDAHQNSTDDAATQPSNRQPQGQDSTTAPPSRSDDQRAPHQPDVPQPDQVSPPPATTTHQPGTGYQSTTAPQDPPVVGQQDSPQQPSAAAQPTAPPTSGSASQTSSSASESSSVPQTVEHGHQASVSDQRTSSPVQQSASPVQQSASPVQQSASPVQQAASPVQQAASPAQQAASPAQQAASPVQQSANTAPQSANPAQRPGGPVQQLPPTSATTRSRPAAQSSSHAPSSSTTAPATTPPPRTSTAPDGSTTPLKTSPSTAAPGMARDRTTTPTAAGAAASLGLTERAVSSRSPEDHEMTTLRSSDPAPHPSDQGTARQDADGRTADQSGSHEDGTDQNHQPSAPFSQVVAEAERAAEDAASARDAVASALGAVKAAEIKVRHDLGAIERSTRTAQGAVLAIGLDPAQQTAQAQQRLDDAVQARDGLVALRYELRAERAEAAERLAAARDALARAQRGGAGPDAVRRAEDAVSSARDTTASLDRRISEVDLAHAQAVADAETAQRDLDQARAVEASATAARAAHDKATSALQQAIRALTTTTEGRSTVADALRTANDAASRSDATLGALRDAATRADAARSDADRAATRAGTHADARAQAEELRAEAENAERRHRDAVAEVERLRARLDDLRNQARTAAAEAAAAQRSADTAAEQAHDAKEEAEQAAAQGEHERGLTQLSFPTHDSQLEFEVLGPRTGLVDALTGLTGMDRARVEEQVSALGDDELLAAIRDGRIRVGDVDVTVRPELHRPADTRTAPPHQQPSSTSSDAATEQTVPLAEATSTSVPIRIPLSFVSPLDLVGTVVRPMVYVGGTVKTAHRYDSSVTFSGSTSTSRSHVPATMSLELSVPGGPRATASLDAGLRLPEITRGEAVAGTLPDGDFRDVKALPATVPQAFEDVLGTSREAAAGLADHLLAPTTTPHTTTVDGGPVTFLPLTDAQVSYVGTTRVDSSSAVSHTRGATTTRGSDANVGLGLYGGGKAHYVGGFLDFSSGLTDGGALSTDDSVTQSSGEHHLVYEVSRDMRVGTGTTEPGEDAPQSTVRTLVQVPVWRARELGLPLPPHLQGESAREATGQTYLFGRDDIKFVDRDKVTEFITSRVRDTDSGLSANGRAAIEAQFRTPDIAKHTLHNAMHGGARAVWTEGGRTHFVDVHAIPAPPDRTEPSGQQDTTTEVKHTEKFQRSYGSSRTARIGAGGAFLPKGTDSPDPNPPKATPEDGLPNPYQGGPTQSTAGPRVALSATYDKGLSTKSGYSGKDGRSAKYSGDMRDYRGALDLVVVHGSTKDPNWAQRFFLGGKLSQSADARYTGPSRTDLDRVLAGDGPTDQHVHRGRVDDAIRVATPADKLDWASRPLPPSGTRPGTYLGAPPPLPSTTVLGPEHFGEFATVEHVTTSPNSTEALDLALAKRIEPVGGGAVRTPPKGSGFWSTWAQKTFTERRVDADGVEHTTEYVYKSSELTRPGTTSAEAVREFQGRVGSLGTASQGLSGLSNSTGGMMREGRLTDFTGTLHGEATYHSPRLVDVRAESTLKRNQAGDQTTSTTSSWGAAVDAEVNANAIPRQDGRTGAMVSGVLGGGAKHGRSHAAELTTGGTQDFEYTGPTALVSVDVRYRYWADMALRNAVHTGRFDPVEVTVDEPGGAVVEVPVQQAIDMFTALGLDVPPELSALRPTPKPGVDDPAHTLAPGPGEYASYSDTAVRDARLAGDDPMAPVRQRLTELGVTDAAQQRQVTDQVDALLNSPTGRLWLPDVLAGQQGLISVPLSGPLFEDVVDVRVREVFDGDRATTQTDAVNPDKVTRSAYVSTSEQHKSTTAWSVNASLNAGVRYAETPPVPPGRPGPDGEVQQSPPEPGAAGGGFTPQLFGGAKSSKTERVLDGSGGTKTTTRVDTDKVGSGTRPVRYELDITRRRAPMPALDTTALGVPKHLLDLDKGVGAAPVRLDGEVDLVSPSSKASPPLAKPPRPPEFELVDAPPDQRPGFSPEDAVRVEAIGQDTAKAVRDAVYAQLSTRMPPPGQTMTGEEVAASAQRPSEFTRPGSSSEHVVHSTAKGTSLHHAANALFTGGGYQAGSVLGTKHPLYDSLFDLQLTGNLRPQDLTFVAALPEGTSMSLTREVESSTPAGTTTTVTTGLSAGASGYGADTHQAAGPSPTSVIAAPPASTTVSDERTTSESSKTGETSGVKHEGRSYLFRADSAEIYSRVHVHGSNWTHKPLGAIKSAFREHGHPQDSTVKITSHDDVHVRVWESTALDKGLLTLHDVWRHAGRLPADQRSYAVSGDPRGATIHPAGRPVPPAGQPAPGAPRGRTLHVAPGVSLSDVTAFVGTLPSDMRPSAYTVAPGQGFTAADVQDAVAGLPEPGTESTTPPGGTSTVETEAAGTTAAEPPAPTEEQARPATEGSSDTAVEQAERGTERPGPARSVPHTDAVGAPSLVSGPDLAAVVPPGTRFADPASFVGLINDGWSPGLAPVHAALAFHETYHGRPQVAHGTAGDARSTMVGASQAVGAAPVAVGRGEDGLAEVVRRVERAGHGADALVFSFGTDGQASAWNVVNHGGTVSLVDAHFGTVVPASPESFHGLGEVFAIPLDAEGRFVPDEHAPPPQPGTVSYEQARLLYDLMAVDTFEHPQHGTVTMPSAHPEDGCYIRAHLWAAKLRALGFDVRKVFMSRGGDVLSTLSHNAYGATADHPRLVTWGYHVAPVLSVDLGNGLPPVEMVFDPAMSYDFSGAVDAPGAGLFRGFVPVREWVRAAGIHGGFPEADLYEPRPWHEGEGPIAPGEVRIRITDAHVVGPPWDVPAPGSFQQADLVVESFLDTAYQHSVEVAHRAEFTEWHESLPPHARQRFNALDAQFGGAALREFHDWFRTMGPADRAALAGRLADPGSSTSDLLPPWNNRVATARVQLAGLSEDDSAQARAVATTLAETYHAGLPQDLGDQVVDVLAHHAAEDGYPAAQALAASLALTQPTDAIGAAPQDTAEPAGPTADPSTVEDPPRGPRKRSREEFESDEGPATRYEPAHARPVPERLVPPAPGDTDALLAAVPPGTRFADPASFAGLVNGTRSEQGRDVNCVDAALAFHETYHGRPRVAGSAPDGVPRGAGTAAAEGLGYAPEMFSRGPAGLAEVIDRVTRAGHGADALVIGFRRGGGGHAWNVVNHHGTVSIVDAQAGTVRPAGTDGFGWLDRVYAIPVDAEGRYVDDTAPAPRAPADPADAYARAEHERAQRAHEVRRAAAAGEEIPVPGTTGRLVPSLGGLRLVGAAVTAELAADLASLSQRDVIALVVGADAQDDERDREPPASLEQLRFPPRGRPEPVDE